MKATPIAKYLDQKGRSEPVAWPPTRQDASPFKPRPAPGPREAQTPAAPVFRRATLLDAVESRARDREPSDRQPFSQADSDTRRRDSIFSRAREVAIARAPPPEPEPEAEPEPDVETRLSEAYHRGVQEGLDAAKAEAATARLLERAELQKRSVVERLDFQMNEYSQLAETISNGLKEIEHRLADVVARILQPLVDQAVSTKIVDELIENIARLRRGGESGLMKITGPEKVLSALKKRVSQIAIDVEYATEEVVEVTVEAQHTNIRTELGAWADLIAGYAEQA